MASCRPTLVGEQRLIPQERRHRSQGRLLGRIERRAKQIEQFQRREVLLRPIGHRQRGIALDQREPGEIAVAVLRSAGGVKLLQQREVLVLERVRVLVGEGDALGAADRAAPADDVQVSVARPIEAGDLRRQERVHDRAEVGVCREDSERLQQPVLPRDLGGRHVLIGVREQLRPQAGFVQDHRLDRALRLQPAQCLDFALDGEIEVPVRVRCAGRDGGT